ncbi:MAG TPA: DNA polymerase III subunit delta' [Pseudolabrys sp.]|nr:DNA polymerase III subunit delta' [Pseudolabrys sp.]
MNEETDGCESPHPRETAALFGQTQAEQILLDSYKSGRMPHAWLIGGEPGIGKATLAYRLARFVLAHPDPFAPDVQGASSLALAADHPVARRVAAQAQGDLLVLERTLNDKGKLRQDIAVDDIRRSVGFFGATPGEGGWRIAIVDAVDELNRAGANALLKVLEEPPQRSLLLLVSHAPGRVLATIRSRCRRLLLRPLEAAEVARAVAAATGRSASDPEIESAAAAADGSAARAFALLDDRARALRQRVLDLFAQLPDPDPRALHALGDALGGSEPQTLAAFIDMVNAWLSARLTSGAQQTARLNRLALAWDRINRAAREADAYNLERKPLVFAVFGMLAEAAHA